MVLTRHVVFIYGYYVGEKVDLQHGSRTVDIVSLMSSLALKSGLRSGVLRWLVVTPPMISSLANDEV